MATSFAMSVAYKHDDCDIRLMPVTAAETFVAGDLVYYDTAVNTIKICGANPSLIAGIALAPASMGLATAGSIWGGVKIPVLILQPEVVIFMASDATAAQADVGDARDISNSSAGVWRMLTTSGNTRIRVRDFSVSPQQEGVFVSFIAANLQFAGIVS